MIGKPEWFSRRKYGGWGVCPKTWHGWAYLAVVIAPLFIIQILPVGTERGRLVALFIWAAIVFVDLMDIMVRMPRDERDRLHEALAERNALWVIIAVLAAGVAYRAAAGIVSNRIDIDPVIIVALVGGLIAKAATNIYLDRTH